MKGDKKDRIMVQLQILPLLVDEVRGVCASVRVGVLTVWVCGCVCMGMHVCGVSYQDSSVFAQVCVGSLCMCASVSHVSEWLH